MDPEIQVDNTGWMYRSYLRYGELGGRTRDPENLCRFVRVCFLWAPLRRYFKGSGVLGGTPLKNTLAGVGIVGALYILGFLADIAWKDWIAALTVTWGIFFGVCLLRIVLWLEDEGGSRYVHRVWDAAVKEPYRTYVLYRKAKASMFCPYIRPVFKSMSEHDTPSRRN